MADGEPIPYGAIADAFRDGEVVPFLGAGASAVYRPSEGAAWREGERFLPFGYELAESLATAGAFPDAEAARNLPLVASYFEHVASDRRGLYRRLRRAFLVEGHPGGVHRLLARIDKPLLIVTTNYDDLMERAFADRGQPVHVVSYVADGEAKGRFVHRLPGGEPKVIERPNQYRGLMGVEEPVLLKIHGAIDRADADADSYVVTEDHYIDYLSLSDLSALLPVPLTTKLTKSHLLFLGYGLRDWNLRVILHRLWGDRKLSWKSWAIQLEPDALDREFWRGRDVDILDLPLDRYTAAVAARIAALEPAP